MKGLSRKVGTAALLVAAALLPAGCGETNNFGGSVDVEKICPYEQGSASGTCQSNPSVSMADGSPLIADLTVVNRMQSFDAGGVGQHARVYRVDVSYKTPNGASLPQRREQLAYTISPRTDAGAPSPTVTFPVTLMSYEQYEYINSNRGRFPEFPFQVSLQVKLYYDTSGAASGTVERLVSVEAVQ
jgi:hypothetical protein